MKVVPALEAMEVTGICMQVIGSVGILRWASFLLDCLWIDKHKICEGSAYFLLPTSLY